MSKLLKIQKPFHFTKLTRGRKARKDLPAPASPKAGRVPRVARLMALAIRFERLVRSGDVADYASLAELGHVSRARVTQIMNLLCLAPDIQEAILFLPRTVRGRDPIILAQLQPIAGQLDWWKQRAMLSNTVHQLARANILPAKN
jgi:hypothetical protein